MEVTLTNGLFVRMAGPPTGQVLLLLHAFADNSLAFVPLFDTPLADRSRPVAVDLAGFGASPRQNNVRTLSEHAETIVMLARSLSGSGRVGLVAHSVASMIAVEVAAGLGERFGGLFSLEGNLTAEDAYFSGRAADLDDAHVFKQNFLDAIWTMAQTHTVMRRSFASSVLVDPIAMWELGRDARASVTGPVEPTSVLARHSTIGLQPAR